MSLEPGHLLPVRANNIFRITGDELRRVQAGHHRAFYAADVKAGVSPGATNHQIVEIIVTRSQPVLHGLRQRQYIQLGGVDVCAPVLRRESI